MENGDMSNQAEIEKLKTYVRANSSTFAVSEKIINTLPDYFSKITNQFYKNAIFTSLLDVQCHIMHNGLINKPKNTKCYDPEAKKYNFPINVPFDNKISDQKKYNFVATKIIDFKLFKEFDINNFFLFFKTNPDFKYYFWNVTFPNIFGYFLSDEYSKSAKEFLDNFKNNHDIYFSGFVSFIKYNFHFQETFTHTFFKEINQINPNDSVENIIDEENIKAQIESVKIALISGIHVLKIQQFEILKFLLTNYPKETQIIIIKEIIIYLLKIISRSPLFVVHNFLFKNRDNNESFLIIDELLKQINKEGLLDCFFRDIIEKGVKEYKPTNPIKLREVIFYRPDKLPLTVLDLTIINNICKIPNFDITSKLNEPLDTSLLFNKAFRVWWFGFVLDTDQPFRRFEMEGDPNLIKKWQSYTDECEKHLIDPLTSAFDGSLDLKMTYFVLYNQKRKILWMKSIEKETKKRLLNDRPLMMYIKSFENTSLLNITSYYSSHFLKYYLISFKRNKMSNLTLKKDKNNASIYSKISEEEEQFFLWIKQFFANNVSIVLLKKFKSCCPGHEIFNYQQIKKEFNVREKIAKNILENDEETIRGNNRVKSILNCLNSKLSEYNNNSETKNFVETEIYVSDFVSSLDSVINNLVLCFYNVKYNVNIQLSNESTNIKFINYSEISQMLENIQSISLFYYIKSFVASQISNINLNESNENQLISFQISSFIQGLKTLNQFLVSMIGKDSESNLDFLPTTHFELDISHVRSQQLFSYALEGKDGIKAPLKQLFDNVSQFVIVREKYLNYFKELEMELKTFADFLNLNT